MIIISHRGYWQEQSERNQEIAFRRSFAMGFGTETDVRDSAGKIVIAHDMPNGDEISFEKVLQIMAGRNLPLALNIKADGQAQAIMQLLDKYEHTNYFTFDMSIPEMVVQVKLGLKVFTGISDIQMAPALFNAVQGVWLDCFNSDWYGPGFIDNLLDNGKSVCIVSADLHQRENCKQWETIKNCKNFKDGRLMLCTDYPERAVEFFYEQN